MVNTWRRNELYVALVDLEKANDRVNRVALWKVLQICWVYGVFLKAMRSHYQEGKVCVQERRKEGKLFLVKASVQQGCVMTLSLFKLFMVSDPECVNV